MTDDQRITPVDVTEIEGSLRIMEEGAVEELYRFGAILLSSAQQRGIRLDSKLTGILNWSSALLAFLLVDAGISHPLGIRRLASFFAMAITLCSIGNSWLGLKSRLWCAPSERDWFREGIMTQSSPLRRYHVVSLLNAHQAQSEGNERRARSLRLGEIAIAASAAAVFAIQFSRLF